MRILALTGSLLLALAVAGLAQAGVSPGPAFYVDGQAYRTVAMPASLLGTGAPEHSFDTIYDFGGEQMNVATAAPGDRDYNGGRWMVHALSFPNGYGAVLAHDENGNGVIDSDAELEDALEAGDAVDTGIVDMFVCPVIKLPASQR